MATIHAGFTYSACQRNYNRLWPALSLRIVRARRAEAIKALATGPLPRDGSDTRNNSFHIIEHVRWMRRNEAFPLARSPGLLHRLR